MHLSLSLGQKLLLSWIGGILSILALVGGLFFYLHVNKREVATLERIESAFASLETEIKARRENLEKITGIIAGRRDVVSSAHMIGSYQDIENYLPSVFDVEKRRLSREISKQAQAAGLDFLMVQDANAFLAGYYLNKGKGETETGYQSFQNGEPVLYAARNGGNGYSKQKNPSPYLELLMASNGAGRADTQFHSTTSSIVMETHAVVALENKGSADKPVGLVHGAYFLDASFISAISKSTGVELAVLQTGGGRLGLLGAVPFGDLSPELPALFEAAAEEEGYRNISTDTHLLGVAQLPIENGQHIFFVFGKERERFATSITAFEQAIYVALFLAAITIVPAAWYYLNRTFTRPINNLLHGVEGLRKGNYASLSGFKRGDEFSVLAQSFNAMSQAIQARENALRMSEERFRALVSYSPNKLHIKDTEGKYILLNRRSEELFGVSNEEAVGKTSSDIFPPDISVVFDEHDQAVLKTGEPLEGEETFNLNDGVHTFLTVKFPILGADGKIVAVGASGFEITERKAMEAQLRRSQKMEAVGQLTGGIAHDFNNLLGVMVGNAEILKDLVGEDKNAQRKVEAIIKAVGRGASLTQRLLAFSRRRFCI